MATLRDNWIVIAIGVAVIAALVLLIWLWWWIPKWQMRGRIFRGEKERADTEDNFRKTVGQALGGAAVLIGAGAAYLQFTQQQQASRDLLISNQVSKGFEQLAGKETAMRLGGLYALEGVMNTSSAYHQPVLEALCAFVREGTIGMIVNETPATDVQAALTVIGRRKEGKSAARGAMPGEVNLGGAKISGADLAGANLSGANLSRADLSHAFLLQADLRDSDLLYADLSHAHLFQANLFQASLTGANLSGAGLSLADLRDAELSNARLDNALLSGANLSHAYTRATNLNDADLSEANLSYADLTGADLSEANLSYADLTGADLSGANLSYAKNLTQDQLDQACGTHVTLPDGKAQDLKPCPGNKWVAPPLNRKTTP